MYKYLLILLLFCSCSSQNDKVSLPTENNNKIISFDQFHNQTKDGDIVLKMGYGAISKMIASQLHEEIKLSHCGIVYKKNNESYIIHSISGEYGNTDGVQKISFEKFYQDTQPKSLFILRYKNTDNRSSIAKIAKIILDKKVPFDHDFILSDSSKLYCSEFVENVLKTATNKSYFETMNINGTNVYTFNAILHSEDFTIINND